MKNIIITTIVLSLLALMLLACAPEVSEATTPPTAMIPATELTDEQLLQEHPDYLDEALLELEEVE